jgi:Zn-dependent protease with chaperone function
VQAARVLDVEDLPELFLSGQFSINASAAGVDRYVIVLHAPLVASLSEAELLAILGHELSHVKCAHQANKTLASYLATFGAQALQAYVPLLGPAAVAALTGPLLHWSRMAELSCDRASLLVVQDRDVVAGALAKLAGWPGQRFGELNFDAIHDQFGEWQHYGEGMLNGLARLSHSVDALSLTHPMPIYRIHAIRQWGASDQFHDIMAGHYPGAMIQARV